MRLRGGHGGQGRTLGGNGGILCGSLLRSGIIGMIGGRAPTCAGGQVQVRAGTASILHAFATLPRKPSFQLPTIVSQDPPSFRMSLRTDLPTPDSRTLTADRYELVVGMEVHAQVQTRSKMFCACATDYAGAPPNTRVCPVCLGLPGSLPVINRAAVEATIRPGLRLTAASTPRRSLRARTTTTRTCPRATRSRSTNCPTARTAGLTSIGPTAPRKPHPHPARAS
jgi:hypothetical protein